MCISLNHQGQGVHLDQEREEAVMDGTQLGSQIYGWIGSPLIHPGSKSPRYSISYLFHHPNNLLFKSTLYLFGIEEILQKICSWCVSILAKSWRVTHPAWSWWWHKPILWLAESKHWRGCPGLGGSRKSNYTKQQVKYVHILLLYTCHASNLLMFCMQMGRNRIELASDRTSFCLQVQCT